MGFYHTYFLYFHLETKPLYDLTTDKTLFKWLPIHEKIFMDLKQRFRHDISNEFSSSDYPVLVHAESSNLGTGCVLIQDFLENVRFQQTREYLIKLRKRCPLNVENPHKVFVQRHNIIGFDFFFFCF